MVINISLDKTEFYKDDYASTGEVPIGISISGLDSTKEYCVMWSCHYCSSDYLFHSPTTEYFYLKNRSSIIISSGSHLHESNINYNGYESAEVYIFINEVKNNCVTILNEFIAYEYIRVYDKYKPIVEGEASIKSVSIRNTNGDIITKAQKGESVRAYYTIENIKSVVDDFYSEATIDDKEVSDELMIISGYSSKTVGTNYWTMGSSNMVLDIEAGHHESGGWIKDDVYSKTLYVEETELETVLMNVHVSDQNGDDVVGANVSIPGALGATTIATNYSGIATGFTLEKNKTYTTTVSPPTGYVSNSGSSYIFTAWVSSTLALSLTKEDTFEITNLELTKLVIDNQTIVRADITATGIGTYRIYVDNDLQWGSHNYPDETSVDIYGLTAENHKICADNVCKDIDLTEDYVSTSLTISVFPTKIGVGQYALIEGQLRIEGKSDILPGLSVKLYLDKGQGYVHMATPNTPADGSGIFEYNYKALVEDAGKILRFRYVFEGDELLLLESSESIVLILKVEAEPVLIETNLELSANPNTNVTPTTIVQLTAYLTDEDNNPMPNGSFVNFYRESELIIMVETTNGWAYCNYQSEIEDSLQTLTFGVDYLGSENEYDVSEDIADVTFKEYIPLKNCIDHLTETECADNGCYWYDNKCNDVPEGTTEVLDVHIKPHSFYDGNYEKALNKTLEKTTNLAGALNNYMTSVTGYEYKDIDILEDQNKEIIVVRVYLKETDETALINPLVVVGIVGVIALILISVGYIIGTSDNEYTAPEVAEIIDDAFDNAEEEAKDIYPNRTTDKEEAKAYVDYMLGILIVRIYGGADLAGEDPNVIITQLTEKANNIKAGIDDGSVDITNIDAIVEAELVYIVDEEMAEYIETIIDEECAFELFGECLISKKALTTLKYAGLAVGGLLIASTASKVIK